jgi:hypothetical protein
MDQLNAFWVGCFEAVDEWVAFADSLCGNSFRKLAVRNTTFLGGKFDFFLEEIHLWFAALIRKPKRGE